MDNIKPINIFIPYESQKWYTVRKLHLISATYFHGKRAQARFFDPNR